MTGPIASTTVPPLLTRLPNAMVVVIAAVLIAIFYWPAFTFGFFIDDGIYVTRNTALQAAPVWRVLVERMNEYEFLPLRDLTYWIDWRLFGDRPLPYHLHNLAWYIAGCCATAFAATRLYVLHGGAEERARMFALIVAAIFLLHPLHIEPVVWVASRKDLMTGFFVLLATGLWAQGLAASRAKLCWLAIACYVAAVLSKTPSVVFPVIAVAMWLAKAKDRTTLPQLFLVGTLIVAGGIAAATAVAVGADTAIISAERLHTSLADSLLLAMRIVGEAALQTVFPVDVRFYNDHLFLAVTSGWNVVAWIGVAVSVTAAVALWIYLRYEALWALGGIWFVVFLAPYLQFIPFRAIAPFSSRFAYVSTFGFALIAAIVINDLRSPKHRRLVATLVMAALGIFTLWHGREWRSADTLALAGAQNAHGTIPPQETVIFEVFLPASRFDEAVIAANRIKDITARQGILLRIENARLMRHGPIDAWREFLRGVAIASDNIVEDVRVAMDIANGCMAAGLFDEASTLYRKMMLSAAYPARAKANLTHNLALALEKAGQPDEALMLFRRAADNPARTRTMRAISWNSVGAILNAKGDTTQAEAAFKSAIELDPGYEYPAMNLLNLYIRAGRHDDMAKFLSSPASELPLVRRYISERALK